MASLEKSLVLDRADIELLGKYVDFHKEYDSGPYFDLISFDEGELERWLWESLRRISGDIEPKWARTPNMGAVDFMAEIFDLANSVDFNFDFRFDLNA